MIIESSAAKTYIRALRTNIDLYLQDGRYIARKWPRMPHTKPTAGTIRNRRALGAAMHWISRLPTILRQAWHTTTAPTGHTTFEVMKRTALRAAHYWPGETPAPDGTIYFPPYEGLISMEWVYLPIPDQWVLRFQYSAYDLDALDKYIVLISDSAPPYEPLYLPYLYTAQHPASARKTVYTYDWAGWEEPILVDYNDALKYTDFTFSFAKHFNQFVIVTPQIQDGRGRKVYFPVCPPLNAPGLP